MKKRKTSELMKPYIEDILKRDDIMYNFIEEKGDLYVETDVSSNRFSEVLEDALCLKQQAESPRKKLVISARTLKNSQKRKRLMKAARTKSYTILRDDIKTAEWVLAG